VTGTPIQNRLGDLAALFKFLDVYPYGDTKRFDADITHLWKAGEPEQAVERLKRLSRCLILRRPKTTIDLPTRTDHRCPVNFTPEERALYEKIKSQVIAHFTEAGGADASSPCAAFVNVIQQINALRMICNMGLYYYSRHGIKPTEYLNTSSEVGDWSSVAQETFNFQCEITSITCQLCKSSFSITERLFGESGHHLINPLFSECLKFVCPDCIQHSHDGNHTKDFLCGHSPPHSFAPVSLNSAILEESVLMPPRLIVGSEMAPSGLPSKVTALLKQLKAQPSDAKRSVI
jgi:SNF2 family DNA or RNA helicase